MALVVFREAAAAPEHRVQTVQVQLAVLVQLAEG